MTERNEARAAMRVPLYAVGGPYQFRHFPLMVSRGYPLPLGASQAPDGVNFAVISRYATAVWLVLSEPCSTEVLAEIPFDPVLCRTGFHWHIRVGGLPDEFCYGYRVDGPRGNGHRYDPTKILLDPASRALSCGKPWGFTGRLPRRSMLTKTMATGRDEDAPWHPQTPREDSIVYELHVRGYTVDRSSGVKRPGTYAGLIEKIPYLKELGITAVELLPIDEFDELDCPFVNPLTGERLRNFWGYSTIAFAAIKAAYAAHPEGAAPWEEFRRMVRAFHEAGIEVILDVVFNHTAEGNESGPTYSFRGLDNSLYYLLDERGQYLNFTGCGNTINSNQPNVRQLLRSCLQILVAEAGVDGFRFDLASVLGRDSKGDMMLEPPVVESFSEDALLGDVKLIAEPWDAAGLYQVADFPGGARWSVWNGRYRDDVRRFWRGDPGMTARSGHAHLRQRRPVRHPRAAALAQLPDLSRRLHAKRPRFLQREAQRGQRRGEPRRHQRKPELELRRRRSERRPQGARAPPPAGAQPDRHAAGLAGRADAAGRRRVPAYSSRQQQRLVPG